MFHLHLAQFSLCTCQKLMGANLSYIYWLMDVSVAGVLTLD